MTPLLLLSTGDSDPDFLYATGFGVESAIYLKFEESDDLLAVGALELERAAAESRAKKVVDVREVGLESGAADFEAANARLAAKLLLERGHKQVRVAPRLPAAWYEELRGAGVEPEIERRCRAGSATGPQRSHCWPGPRSRTRCCGWTASP